MHAPPNRLPDALERWFSGRGWALHPHQVQMFDRAAEPALLLIAPTGGGKTLAGFLPTLAELGPAPGPGLHTLYVSPLKALAADIRRNLKAPLDALGWAIRVEDRTGDTPYSRRQRQRADPPHILLTTPESLALMLSQEDAARTFAGVSRVIVDEIHALAESKRGDQLMLCLGRLQSIAPGLRRVGLSATVEDTSAIARYLARHPDPCPVIHADPGPDPDIRILDTAEPPPWAGGNGRYAIPAILDEVRRARTTLIFINTRALAEMFFRALWLANADDLPIALHHGSLSREARDRVETAMVRGELRAVVCTGTLDLGIDWGDVDLVIQVGAPKNVKRLVQRIGRANHRYDCPSRALLVPANRFEVVECRAALDAVRDGTLDGEPRGPGPRDVLCQHILISGAAGGFDADTLFAEVATVGPYVGLSRTDFDACVEFCATGGYALRAYDRWQRLVCRNGWWGLRDPRAARAIRMNLGTIVDAETLAVRWRNSRGGPPLGEVEEAFAATLTAGETFLIGGKVVRYEGLNEMTVEVSQDATREPRIAVFSGTKFATSTVLATRVADMIAGGNWADLPDHTAGWLALQRSISALPGTDRMLIESYVHEGRHFTCFYGYAGRNALQTLGLLTTQAMEDAGLGPLGFVTNDYALLVWSLDEIADPAALLDPARLRENFTGWLGGNAVMKRAFRNVATIAGLIERNHPGKRKSGRQATFSSDILYDTLARYDPDHLLLQITREEAMRGLVDFGRIEAMLAAYDGRLRHVHAPHITPLSAPLLLEVGKVFLRGSGQQRLAEAEAERLLAAAGMDGLAAGAVA